MPIGERERRVAAGRLFAETVARRRITKRWLEEQSGVSTRTLRRLELGEPVARATYRRVGEALGFPDGWWITAIDAVGTDPDTKAGVAPAPGVAVLALYRTLTELGELEPGSRGIAEQLAADWNIHARNELRVRIGRARTRRS